MATNKNVEFEPMATRCCGLDVHKVEIVATVEGEGIKRETRTFKSTTRSLAELKEWLMSLGVTYVAMESTGVYWKPVFNILESDGLTILVVNARHIKYVPGHKTDKKDSAWICKLLRAGLLKGSFVPPKETSKLAIKKSRNNSKQLRINEAEGNSDTIQYISLLAILTKKAPSIEGAFFVFVVWVSWQC